MQDTTTATTTTTEPSEQNVTEPEKPGNPDSSFNWDHMGNVLAGLIFHDFLLVFIIVLVLIVLRFGFDFDFFRKDDAKKENMKHMFSEADA